MDSRANVAYYSLRPSGAGWRCCLYRRSFILGRLRRAALFGCPAPCLPHGNRAACGTRQEQTAWWGDSEKMSCRTKMTPPWPSARLTITALCRVVSVGLTAVCQYHTADDDVGAEPRPTCFVAYLHCLCAGEFPQSTNTRVGRACMYESCRNG